MATVSRHRDAMFTEMGIDRTVVQAASGPAREWLGAALAEGRYLGLLVVTGGDVVGGVGVTWLDLPPNMHTALPRRGYILNMYVDPPHRGRGLARRLLDGAVEVCRSHGVDVVTLHASDAGRPLYAASGFTATNEMRLTLREEPH
ncbi:MAG: GNAT family N-acetyltransferase [Tetrasphaera sp.]|nr:GNAT family N-acetyltransferase [Tetrasphaera sp.]